MKFDIVKKRKTWYTISSVLVMISILMVIIFKIPFGIDFTGGSLLEIEYTQTPSVIDVRSELEELGYANASVQESGENVSLIRLPNITETEHQDILASFEERFGELDELRFDSIGPVIGKELKTKSLMALAVALLVIVVYVGWAFRKVSEPVASWKYGVLTIVAAFHDILIPIGVFTLLGQSLNFQVDTAFIAALLTILGYSINDTIVVFDRTRENLARDGASDFENVVSKSVKQTLTRSIYTSITTLLALAAIFLFGGETTRSFALTMIIGISAGAYSSIFLASPLLVTWYKWQKKE